MRLLPARPPSCKRLPVDLTDSEPARERLHALELLELIDQMVTGGKRHRPSQEHRRRLAQGPPAPHSTCVESGPGSGPGGTAA